MKKLSLISIYSILIFIIPAFISGIYHVYIEGVCDPKFGCFGTFKLELFIALMFALVSTVVQFIVLLFIRVHKYSIYLAVATLILGAVYSPLIIESAYLSSDTENVLAWVLVSFIAYVTAYGCSRIASGIRH